MRAWSCLTLVLALGALGFAHAAEVSTDDIVKALRPDSNATGDTSRGIRAIAAPSIDLSIEFASGSANLTPSATSQLDQLGAALTNSALASDKFGIEGHTDTVGSDTTNLSLSQQRAAAVASYLEAKYSIASARLQTSGVGKAGLLVQTPDQTAEPKNRRVHITNLGG